MYQSSNLFPQSQQPPISQNFQPQPQPFIQQQNQPLFQQSQPQLQPQFQQQLQQPQGGYNNYALQQPADSYSYNRSSSLNLQQNVGINPTPDQNFQWKMSQRPDPFALSIGNPNRDREIMNLNTSFRQRVSEYETQLTENWKMLSLSEDNRNSMNSINKRMKNELYSLANNAVLLRTEIKKQTLTLNELKTENNAHIAIVNDFNQFCDFVKKGRLPTVQLPSSFLQLVTEKISNSLEVLKKKIIEIEELSFLQLNAQNEGSDESDYELFLMLIEEMYSYYNYVAFIVIKFNENYHDFRSKTLENFKGLGYVDLEKTLEFETKKLYRDEMIENLIGIANLIETTKKSERENSENMNIIKEKERSGRRNMIFKNNNLQENDWVEKARKKI